MEHQIYRHENYPFLDERLAAYADSDFYPFHMPGHKRAELHFTNPYKIDITEIEGFDNLHHAQEILLQAQERLCELYQSRKSYYLVNGSTCGLLSAIGALTRVKKEIIIARNCHKAVYNAVKIFNLKAFYVYPEVMACGIQGTINPDDVENALNCHPNAGVVVITSPTYDGIVSDIRKIAEITQKYHAYLIVDEAHGAHFSLSSYFPESAVRHGADIVIQSLHKTLPSFTQTAVLHIAGSRVDCSQVEEMLGIFQTSSPSYVLMAGIERCVKLINQSGKLLFEKYHENLVHFYQECSELRCLHVLTKEDYGSNQVFDVDMSKIVVCTAGTQMDGRQLYEKLLNTYHLQMEMYSAQYVLAMTSLMDTKEGFVRFLCALKEIDQELYLQSSYKEYSMQIQFYEDYNSFTVTLFMQKAYAARKKILEVSEIDHYYIEETPLEKCSGKVCAEYIYLYPPGIPMIVPGEEMTGELITLLNECKNMGLHVQGAKDRQYRKILTVAQPLRNRL